MNEHAIPGRERMQLIRARERLGLFQHELARKIGASPVTVSRVETGVRHPSLALMQRWAKALGPDVSLDIFWVSYAKPRKRRARSPEPAA
jgi:DNA-binding XRE family transcriptional regulator